VRPGLFPLGQVGLVTAAVDGDLLLGKVQLDDGVDGPEEELAVVADQHGRRPQFGDELFQPVQAGQVQVVGRLVEQEDVVPAEQQRGQ
jgi:hypothetical protein